jgi:predicted glycosyltransferase
MLAICEHLHSSIQDLSILILSGSPMLQSFRVLQGIDYIKLPCLKRAEGGELGVRFLELELEEIVRLRRELILSTVVSFRPDVVLVDKKPDGLAGELEPSLRYIRCNLPGTKIALVLRDILDSAQVTIKNWTERGSFKIVQWYYDDVLVLGAQQVFDVCAEYQFPKSLAKKVRYCGYVARTAKVRPPKEVRAETGIAEDEKFVLVTSGGGEDGYQILSAYVGAAKLLASTNNVKSLIVTGPELALDRAQSLQRSVEPDSGVQLLEFTPDMMSLINAADVVVSMGGYNTICELLSLGKRAVVVPRVTPVQEQGMRMERLAGFAEFKTLLPGQLTPQSMEQAVSEQINASREVPQLRHSVDMGALPRITRLIARHAFSGKAAAILDVSTSQPHWVF